MATKSSKSAEVSSKQVPKKTRATKSVAKPAGTAAKQAPGKSRKEKSAESPEPATATRKKRVAKTTSPKVSSSLSLDPKPTVKTPKISNEEISLRAYFIAERRRKMGWPGDSATDWLDAESQLLAEVLEKPLKKR